MFGLANKPSIDEREANINFMELVKSFDDTVNITEQDLVKTMTGKVMNTITDPLGIFLMKQFECHIRSELGKGKTVKEIEEETNNIDVNELSTKIASSLQNIFIEDNDDSNIIAQGTPAPRTVPAAEIATRSIITEDAVIVPPVGSTRTWNPGEPVRTV